MSSQRTERSPKGMGIALGFKDPTALIQQVLGNSTPEAALREVVKNSMEGNRRHTKREGRGATRIDIYAGKGGRSTIILDNGPGMDERVLHDSMTQFGAGMKERGRQKNQGMGAKLIGAVHNPDGFIVTSWVDRTTAYQIVLKVQYNPELDAEVITWIPDSDGNAVRRVSIPRDATTQSGTQVELMNYKFLPYVIMKYLNSRFEHFNTEDAPQGVAVRVHRASGEEGPYEDRALGYAGCLKRISREGDFGKVVVKGPKSIEFLWCIRDSAKDRQAALTHFCNHYFSVPCLGYSFQGEMYERVAASRGASVLTGWGIRAGGRDVILIPQVQGPEVTPNLTRTNLGDTFDREELRERVQENLPQRILDYMDDFEAEHFDEHTDTVADKLLRLLATPRTFDPGSDEVITPQSLSDGVSSSDERSGSRDRSKKKKRRKNRSRGYARTVFVDEAQLGKDLVHYDEVNHVIQINRDHRSIQRLLKMVDGVPRNHSRSWLTSEALGHIKAQASAAYNNLAQEREEDPSDDDLAAALSMFPGAVIFLSNPSKFKLTKSTGK